LLSNNQPVDEVGRKKICLPCIVKPLLLQIFVESRQPCNNETV